MKKLTIATLISAALSAGAFAGNGLEKIDTTFADLDNDDNGYISREEADDDEIFAHFSKIDANSDMKLSIKEFNAHVMKYPHHFDGEVVASAKAMKKSMNDGTIETEVVIDSDLDEHVASVKDKKMTHELRAETKSETGEKVLKKQVAVTTEKTVIAKSEFEMMDANNDGELTKAEASRSGVTRDFDKIDVNDDELITRNEYARYQQLSVGNYEE
ncbi:calcium-binding protein [Alteromonas gracilis]|uniref:calcium-binding protein n=1 Tax=Alteromonas gracilis TaxID=1479524 RepID=UPI003734D8B5